MAALPLLGYVYGTLLGTIGAVNLWRASRRSLSCMRAFIVLSAVLLASDSRLQLLRAIGTFEPDCRLPRLPRRPRPARAVRGRRSSRRQWGPWGQTLSLVSKIEAN